MAEVPADFFSPVHTVLGSLAAAAACFACCSASACLPFSASSLPCSAACFSFAFQPPPPSPPRPPPPAGGAGGGGGGGGAPSADGTGSSEPVTPASDTCAVQFVPSQYRSSCR